jgi:hypothetical protein
VPTYSSPAEGLMTWHPDVPVGSGAVELGRRFHSILAQLETGDYVGASDAMRHWADDGDLVDLPEEMLARIRICVMDARADLIHMEPDAARAHIRAALVLAGAPV